MITSFLQLKNYPTDLSKVNLGMILIDFMVTYSEFNQNYNGIYTQLPPSYGKSPTPEKPNQYPVPILIQNVQIDDPISPMNNVGKSSFKFEEIKQALRNASFFAFGSCFCSSHNSQLETAL